MNLEDRGTLTPQERQQYCDTDAVIGELTNVTDLRGDQLAYWKRPSDGKLFFAVSTAKHNEVPVVVIQSLDGETCVLYNQAMNI